MLPLSSFSLIALPSPPAMMSLRNGSDRLLRFFNLKRSTKDKQSPASHSETTMPKPKLNESTPASQSENRPFTDEKPDRSAETQHNKQRAADKQADSHLKMKEQTPETEHVPSEQGKKEKSKCACVGVKGKQCCVSPCPCPCNCNWLCGGRGDARPWLVVIMVMRG